MEHIKRFIGFNPDFIGSLAALVCAIHCMVFPILLSIGLVSTSHHNHAFDFIFMAFGVLIAAYVLIKDFFSHKDPLPVVISLIGFVLLYIGVESHGSLFLLSVAGGVTITAAHYLNWRLTHSH